MSTPMEVRQELIDQVAEIEEMDAEAAVALRGLYALYFTSKATANTAEKQFLLGEGFRFSLESKVSYVQDKLIFAQEADRHYHQGEPASTE